jgi:hypothetical protein
MSVPKGVVSMYFDLQHFSLLRVVEAAPARLMVIHTRSDQLIDALAGADTEGIVVKLVERISDEEALQDTIENWLLTPTIQKLIFLIDMSKDFAKEKANFARIKVEQFCEETGDFDRRKQFVLVLHYSTSTSFGTQSYPALFLSGWDHWFLDSIGDKSECLNVDHLLSIACGEKVEVPFDLRVLIPKVLHHLSFQPIFYAQQILPSDRGFLQQRKRLQRLLRSTMDNGDHTMEDMICDRFVTYWLGNELLRITHESSSALLAGTTQLSMTASLQSRLLQDLQVFFSYMLIEANQWMNLDLLEKEEMGSSVLVLFGAIAKEIPVPPFEELKLQRNRLGILRPLPCISMNYVPLFPFFQLVSEFLDQHVKASEESLRGRGEPLESRRAFIDAERSLYEGNLDGERKRRLHSTERRQIVLGVIGAVKDEEGDSLAQSYFEQFLRSKIVFNQEANKEWWLTNLQIVGSWKNILSYHVISLCSQGEIRRLAALASFGKFFGADMASGVSGMAESIEDVDGLVALSRSTQMWDNSLADENSRRLRCICFASLTGVQKNFAAENHPIDLEASTSATDEVATNQTHLPATLTFFLSPTWLRLTTAYLQSDFDLLCRAQSDINAVVFSMYHIFRTLGQPDDHFGIPASLIGCISSNLALNVPSPDQPLLHFIPKWLRKPGHRPETQTSLGSIFESYYHMYAEGLADTLFDVTLRLATERRKNDNSEALFLLLGHAIEEETSVGGRHFERQVSVSALGATLDEKRVGPITIAACLTLFVAQVGYEIATTMKCAALDGVYAEEASKFVEALMHQEAAYWSVLLVSVILRIRGEGTLMQALGDNGAVGQQRWSKPWREGMPSMSAEAIGNLERIESELAESIHDEAQTARDMLLCPHCRRRFQIAAMNCGQFTCGSDAHLLNGRRYFGNHAAGDDYGCGKDFTINQALQYQTDDSRIQELRRNMEQCMERVAQCEVGSRLWDSARTFVVPDILIVEPECQSCLPTKCILPKNVSNEQAPTMILRLCLDSQAVGQSLKLLPDFIQVEFQLVLFAKRFS